MANDYRKSSLVAMTMCKTEDVGWLEHIVQEVWSDKMLACRFCNDLLADNSVTAVISIKGYKICDSLYGGLHHYVNIGEYNQWC